MKKYCCEQMQDDLTRACDLHKNDRYACPDALISYSSKYNSYSLIIHDGGSSSIEIQFCPWCGTEFSKSG